jgi:hypothetical protein
MNQKSDTVVDRGMVIGYQNPAFVSKLCLKKYSDYGILKSGYHHIPRQKGIVIISSLKLIIII